MFLKILIMNKGWISIHRKMQDHWLWKEKRQFSKLEAWFDILFMANHKDNKFILGNELMNVKRGSFITSELKLMERWKWSKSKVRSFLIILQKDKMIIKKSDNKKTTLTVLNYNDYQDFKTTKEHQTDFKPTSKGLQKDTNNNDNNINKENKHYTKKEFLNDWNRCRTKTLDKPSFLNRIDYDTNNTLNEIIKDCDNIYKIMPEALIGFFKQQLFPNGQDYTTNAKHFLNHFNTYLQAYHDKNANIYGK